MTVHKPPLTGGPPARAMILAGDIGGTNTRLALADAGPSGVRLRSERTFPSRDWTSLEAVVAEFLAGHRTTLEGASFGIAGPVREGRCEATNLPWVVDSASVAQMLRLKRVGLINDLVANAHGIPALRVRDLVTLNRGARHAAGSCAIIAAGTGLGEAGIYWDGSAHHPFASEGGHVDFAPRNRVEMALLEYLMKRHGRVSCERIVSGPGLVNVYRYFRDQGREPSWLARELREGDPAAVISRNAMSGKSPLCVHALDLFVSVYGAEAGNLALTVMATGGVYLGGGIAPKLVSKLKEPGFMNAFTAKGRLSPLLREIPVRVIMNPKTALLGAARHAALRLKD